MVPPPPAPDDGPDSAAHAERLPLHSRARVMKERQQTAYRCPGAVLANRQQRRSHGCRFHTFAEVPIPHGAVLLKATQLLVSSPSVAPEYGMRLYIRGFCKVLMFSPTVKHAGSTPKVLLHFTVF